LIIANTGGAVGDATGDDDESAAAQWRKAALLNDMAVSEGWWAEQCSLLTMTLYDGPAVLWMLKDPLSTDSTPGSHGLDTYLKCVTCQMSAITETMNEKKKNGRIGSTMRRRLGLRPAFPGTRHSLASGWVTTSRAH
jgi:hypothetical protein